MAPLNDNRLLDSKRREVAERVKLAGFGRQDFRFLDADKASLSTSLVHLPEDDEAPADDGTDIGSGHSSLL